MNEPPNPPEANQPPSDSTPPPPPPPFTPPPAAEPPAATPPPPGAPPKKSAMPWVLGGCGCLTLIAIIAIILGIMIHKAKQKVTEFKSDFKSTLKSLDDTSKAFTDPSSVNKDDGWSVYVNYKDSLPPSLQEKFIAFRFIYPKTFKVQPQSDVNFVKVERYAGPGEENTAENFAVGSAWFDPPTLQSTALYDKLLDTLGKQIGRSFHNYTEVKRIDLAVDGVTSRAVLFEADFNDAAKTKIYGKTIVVHPPGKKNGVAILFLGTSLSRDIKSADDLGVKGDTAEILRSFSFL
jgi:hypothetical protein